MRALAHAVAALAALSPAATRAADGWADGWMFASPAGFAAPVAEARGGTLRLATVGNANTFGFWESPLLDVGGSGARVLRVTVAMRAAGAASTALPVRRIRTSTPDFSRSDVTVITSEADGALAAAARFEHFAVLPGQGTAPRVRVSIDVLNFGGTDAAASTTIIEDVTIDDVTDALAAAPRTKFADHLFIGANPIGMEPGTVPELLAPRFLEGGLGLGIAGDPEVADTGTTFGFWTAPLGVAMPPGLYLLEWDIGSTQPDPNDLPTYRLRVNEGTFQFSHYVNIASTEAAPAAYGRTIAQWVRVPEEAAGAPVVSFDFLTTPADGDDAASAIYLRALRGYGPVGRSTIGGSREK